MSTAPRDADQRPLWTRIICGSLGVVSVVGGVVSFVCQVWHDAAYWIPSIPLIMGGFLPIVWALPDGNRIISVPNPFRESRHEYSPDEIRELQKYFNKISAVIGCIFALIVASLLIAGWLTKP
jgi:hypothetical protein